MTTQTPSLKELYFGDLDRELTVTGAVLERLPEDKFGWKPHEKSMSLGQLGRHVAHLPDWAKGAIADDELDIATVKHPPETRTSRELLEFFDQNATALREAVAKFDVAKLNDPWPMRRGKDIWATRPRATVFRLWCFNHMIHHRGQLCLYLRLLNVPVPTVYFNTADNQEWVFP